MEYPRNSLINQPIFFWIAHARKKGGRGEGKENFFRGISYLMLKSGCDQSDYKYVVIAHCEMCKIQKQ